MPINNPALASAGVIAISVAIAAAVAVYESPELRRLAEDLRRRVALAIHALGDNIEPGNREPLFNRPEDADGFLRTRGTAESGGVVADDETQRRQREELMYWNALKLEKEALELRARAETEEGQKSSEETQQQGSQQPELRRGTTFDDFMSPARGAGSGTFVFNTGANVQPNDEGLVQRRPTAGVSRAMNASVFSNPFGDEYQISMDDHQDLMAPTKDELPEKTLQSSAFSAPPPTFACPHNPIDDDLSDIYADVPTPKRRPSVPEAQAQPPLVDVTTPKSQARSITVDHDEPAAAAAAVAVTAAAVAAAAAPAAPASEAGQSAASADAFASIQAWARTQTSQPSFYSPLPASPAAPLSVASDPEIISAGDLTPTDTLSLAGSGEDVAKDVARAESNFDVMSQSEGMDTPASWTEVGSVMSDEEEQDRPVHA